MKKKSESGCERQSQWKEGVRENGCESARERELEWWLMV